MSNIKSSSIVILRTVIQKKGEPFENQFLSSLSPELKKVYQSVLNTTWTPEDIQGQIYEKCANALFPHDQDKLISLGKLIAQHSYTGVYRIFIRIPSRQFVLKRWANIWQTYHDDGQPYIETTDRSATLIVRDLPMLPKATRLVTCGHILTILEMVNAENGRVQHIDNNPNAWCWRVTWTK